MKYENYVWQTSAEEVVSTVEFVARSKATLVEFGVAGRTADAAREAAEFGWLEFVANGVVRITDKGRHLTMEKDPVGWALNVASVRRIVDKGPSIGYLLRVGRKWNPGTSVRSPAAPWYRQFDNKAVR